MQRLKTTYFFLLFWMALGHGVAHASYPQPLCIQLVTDSDVVLNLLGRPIPLKNYSIDQFSLEEDVLELGVKAYLKPLEASRFPQTHATFRLIQRDFLNDVLKEPKLIEHFNFFKTKLYAEEMHKNVIENNWNPDDLHEINFSSYLDVVRGKDSNLILSSDYQPSHFDLIILTGLMAAARQKCRESFFNSSPVRMAATLMEGLDYYIRFVYRAVNGPEFLTGVRRVSWGDHRMVLDGPKLDMPISSLFVLASGDLTAPDLLRLQANWVQPLGFSKKPAQVDGSWFEELQLWRHDLFHLNSIIQFEVGALSQYASLIQTLPKRQKVLAWSIFLHFLHEETWVPNHHTNRLKFPDLMEKLFHQGGWRDLRSLPFDAYRSRSGIPWRPWLIERLRDTADFGSLEFLGIRQPFTEAEIEDGFATIETLMKKHLGEK